MDNTQIEPEEDFASAWEAMGQDSSIAVPSKGDIREGTIISARGDEILVDIGAKEDAVVSSYDLQHMSNEERRELQVGKKLYVYVTRSEDRDSELVVSINLARAYADWQEAEKLRESAEPVQCTVTGSNKGGLVCNWRGLQGFIPLYAADLGASATVLGWLTSATLIPYVITSLWAARIGARIGEKRTVAIGLLVVCLAVAVVPWIKTVPLLILTRIIHGLGRGITYPITMGLSIKSVAQEERASAMGIFQAIYALGMFAGPTLSGIVADRWGMSAVFWTSAAVSLGAVTLLLVGSRYLRGRS